MKLINEMRRKAVIDENGFMALEDQSPELTQTQVCSFSYTKCENTVAGSKSGGTH